MAILKILNGTGKYHDPMAREGVLKYIAAVRRFLVSTVDVFGLIQTTLPKVWKKLQLNSERQKVFNYDTSSLPFIQKKPEILRW